MLLLFRPPSFFSSCPSLITEGPDIRTERFRTKPISAPKGLGRGPIVFLCAFSASFFFRSWPLLITEGPISGPNGFEQNRYRLPKGFGRGPDANYLFFFRALLFLIRAPPNYQRAGI